VARDAWRAGRDNEGEGARRASRGERANLAPLRMIVPYLKRYRGMVATTVVALVVSALATLALPLGVRRMVDFGFGGDNAAMIDSYFLTIFAIGALLAVASATRFYAVTWLGERVVADLRNDVFARRRSHVASGRRHHPDQDRRWQHGVCQPA